MKKIRILTLLLALIIILPSMSTSISAEEETQVEEPESPEKVLDRLALMIFKSTVPIFGIPWSVLRFTEPETFTVSSDVIEIGYDESKTITIGLINESSGDYKSLNDFEKHPLFTGYDYQFDLELPDYLPEGAFEARFSPESLYVFTDGKVKTELTLHSYIQPDVNIPENIIIRVNITKFVTAGNLYLPPKGQRGFFPFNLITGKRNTILWLLGATGVTNPVPFGKIYSGIRDPDYTTYVDFVVKVKRTHLIDIESQVDSIRLNPDSVYDLPIKVKNLGSHIDTFNFDVDVSNTNGLILSPPTSITLEPNEERELTVGIITSEKFFDQGTLHSVTVNAYSIYDENNTFNKTIPIVTEGFYISEFGGALLLIILTVFLIFCYIIYLNRRRLTNFGLKKIKKFIEKPADKKTKDKKIKETKEKKKVKLKEKAKEKPPKKEISKSEEQKEEIKKSGPTAEQIEKIKKKNITKRKKEIDEHQKKIAIRKAKREQEKQKRRFSI